MPYCRLGVVFWLLVVLLYSPGRADAGDLFGWKKPSAAAVPQAPYNPPRAVAGSPPAPYRYPACQKRQLSLVRLRLRRAHVQLGLFRGRVSSGLHATHHGYYGDYTQWAWRQGTEFWPSRVGRAYRREAQNPNTKSETNPKHKIQTRNTPGFCHLGFVF